MNSRFLAVVLALLAGPLSALAEDVTVIAVIVNKDNPVDTLSLVELARMYRGEREQWPDEQKIIPTNHGMDSDIRRRFYLSVLGVPPTQKFFIPNTPIPFHVSSFKSTRVILKYVSTTPTAIAYVSAEDVDSSVKVVQIEGSLPGNPRYPIK
jgi:ABC-type phosphate transport system substrate-binding protein